MRSHYFAKPSPTLEVQGSSKIFCNSVEWGQLTSLIGTYSKFDQSAQSSQHSLKEVYCV